MGGHSAQRLAATTTEEPVTYPLGVATDTTGHSTVVWGTCRSAKPSVSILFS